MATFNSHEEFFDHLGETWDPKDPKRSEKNLSRRVYKSTECGAWAALVPPGRERTATMTERWIFVYLSLLEGPALGLCIRGDEWYARSDLNEDVRNYAEPLGDAVTWEAFRRDVRPGQNGVIRVFSMDASMAVEADVPVGLYKMTREGVRIGSIVEGSDACVDGATLLYPFTEDEWDKAVADVEAECDRLWNEANNEEETDE